MTTPQKRSKDWGYAVEVAALKTLQQLFPKLKRTGSVAYKKAAADLVQEGVGAAPFHLVVTRDKRRPLLVTLSADDLVRMVGHLRLNSVYVQVKGRERTWIGRLYDELREATGR